MIHFYRDYKSEFASSDTRCTFLASHTMIVVKLLYCLIIVHACSATFCRRTNRPIEIYTWLDRGSSCSFVFLQIEWTSTLNGRTFYFLNVRTLFLIFYKIFVFVHVLAYLRIYSRSSWMHGFPQSTKWLTRSQFCRVTLICGRWETFRGQTDRLNILFVISFRCIDVRLRNI